MDDEVSESEMARSGSVTCFSRNSISALFKCSLSCLVLLALIYIVLLLIATISSIQTVTLYKTLGYISLIIVFNGPTGFYACCKQSYCALFAYLFVGSYHLYALVIYIWFNLNSKAFSEGPASTSIEGNSNRSNDLLLHQTTTGTYTVVVVLTLIMCSARIVSITNQVEPAKVIVVDNNPSE